MSTLQPALRLFITRSFGLSKVSVLNSTLQIPATGRPVVDNLNLLTITLAILLEHPFYIPQCPCKSLNVGIRVKKHREDVKDRVLVALKKHNKIKNGRTINLYHNFMIIIQPFKHTNLKLLWHCIFWSSAKNSYANNGKNQFDE
jgi:hypothetical protein